MNNPVLQSLASYFLAHKDQCVLLATHVRADGDALGSIFGLHTILNENGIEADIFFSETISEKYQAVLPHVDVIKNENSIIWEKYNSIIFLDASSLERTQIPTIVENYNGDIAVIDHHIDNSHFGKSNFICALSSNSEIIFRATQMAGFEISKVAATALLLGVLTDTGCLRFSNTNYDSCTCVANLLKFKADHQLIINQLYFSKSLNQKYFESELLLEHLHFFADNKVAIAIITPHLLEKYAIDMKDQEGLIDEVRAIEGVEIAILLSQLLDGRIKASLRSKNINYPVGPIARSLGGGGHEMASGIIFNTTDLLDAQKQLVKAYSNLF